MAPKRPATRSRLPRTTRAAATPRSGSSRRSQQIKRDSEALDRRSIAVGPFARLDAGAVAERDGKTRGVISHLFGSQAAFQAETMERRARRRRLDRAGRAPRPAEHRRRGRLARRPARRPGGARAAPRRAPADRLRDAVGAVAEHRPLRAVERAHQRAEPRGAPAVDRPARAGVRARRSSTSGCGCATA